MHVFLLSSLKPFTSSLSMADFLLPPPQRTLNPRAPEFHPTATTMISCSVAPICYFPLPPPAPHPSMFPPHSTSYSCLPYYATHFPQPPISTFYTTNPLALPPHQPSLPLPPPYPSASSSATPQTLPLHTTSSTLPPQPPTPPPRARRQQTAADHDDDVHRQPWLSEMAHHDAAAHRWPRGRLGRSRDFTRKSRPRSSTGGKAGRRNSIGHGVLKCTTSPLADDHRIGNDSVNMSTRDSNGASNIGSRKPGTRTYYERMGKKAKAPLIPVKADGAETTVMIRNIPNQYSRQDLVEFLDNFCKRENESHRINVGAVDDGDGGDNGELVPTFAYDFVYLPIDFGTHVNRGFAFVNFTSHVAVWKLLMYNSSDQRWEKCESGKLRDIACAKIQGKRALIDHFEKSVFTCSSPGYLPICFSPPRDGSDKQTDLKTVGKMMRRLSISKSTGCSS